MRSKTWNADPNRYFERPQAVKSNDIAAIPSPAVFLLRCFASSFYTAFLSQTTLLSLFATTPSSKA